MKPMCRFDILSCGLCLALLAVGCSDSSPQCTEDATCDDGLACNGIETCSESGSCEDGVPPMLGEGVDCIECTEAADCDDGVFCNGAERCGDGDFCEAGTPPSIDDEVECTNDSCDEEEDEIVNEPDDSLCDTGFVCDATMGCTGPSDACAIREAEHPSYTTPNRDVALCGNEYSPENADTACGSGWHVCLLSEWEARFPAGVYPEGLLSTWGADQTVRCLGDVWHAEAPNERTWQGDVCFDMADLSNASYNPWNDGKYLYSNDGTSILEGDGGCCDYDNGFNPDSHDPGDTEYLAVYCCRD